MIYEKFMTQEIIASDGTWTIGHVDGKAAIWTGNSIKLNEDDIFDFCDEDDTFGVDYDDQYRVIDGEWINENK